MRSHEPPIERTDEPHRLDENAALRSVVEGTASDTGERFFRSLVDNLRRALGTMGAWVATLDEERGELRALSMRMRERLARRFHVPRRGNAVRERRSRSGGRSTSRTASSSSIAATLR